MAKQFTTTVRRAYDLAAVIESFSPSEVAKLRGEDSIGNLKLADKLIEELKTPCKDFIEKMDKVLAVTQEIVDKFQKESKTLDVTEAEKEKAMQPLVDRANKEIAEKEKEIDARLHFTDEAKKNIVVKIESDDRFNFLKLNVLPKVVDKYKIQKALMQTVEDIENAKEA